MRDPIIDFRPRLLLVYCLIFVGLSLGCSGDDMTSEVSIDLSADRGSDDAAFLDAERMSDFGMRPDIARLEDANVPDFELDAAPDAAADAMPMDAIIIDATPVQSGPIEPPEGADPSPEEAAFDWNGIGNTYIGRLIPLSPIDWSNSRLYGVARVLEESDSEECVCFDVDCATCSRGMCGAQNCTYDLNPNHTLTKYHVELRGVDDDSFAVTFEVNISANPPIGYTNIIDVLNRIERIPPAYWYGLKIITVFGRGIQFLHGSYFNGATAYGSMNYIDTQSADLPTLLHELGHTFEQYTRIGNPPAQVPQSNILDPIWRHAIRRDNNRTSRYGNSNEWEDLAEFARIYAEASIDGSLISLRNLASERYRIWSRILGNGATILE